MGRNKNIAKFSWNLFHLRKARSDWKCCICHGDIKVGDVYMDGKRFYNKAHKACVDNLTEDVKVFGAGVWIYCDQHLRPHLTGWCTVSCKLHKTLLKAKNEKDAYSECRERGFKLYADLEKG